MCLCVCIRACVYVCVCACVGVAIACILLRHQWNWYTVFPRKDAAATIYFSSTAMRRLFEGGYYSKYRRRGDYRISELPQCGDYSRVATIRSTDVVATIYFRATAMRQLFNGGYYSRCGVYSRKYGILPFCHSEVLKKNLPGR